MYEWPLVTIIMPIRNEELYIRRSLTSILRQEYPGKCLEVLIVDGMSDDSTRDIVQELTVGNMHFAMRIVDNPGRIVPTALNIGLRHSRGDVIIRIDGHCGIPADYVRRCVELLGRTGADCVGGPIVAVGETYAAHVIAVAQSSPFGVGGAAFRTRLKRAGNVDTLAFGAYRRDVFKRLGEFDEELVRNQDDEFNFRLIQAGGKIWLDPSIRSFYYNRATLRGLWRQYFQYGFYKVRVMQKRGGVQSWRHLVPAIFVLGLFGSLAIGLITGQALWALGAGGSYVMANGLASLWAARRDWQSLPFLPLAFGTLHLAYGLGFLKAVFDFIILRRKGPQNVATMPDSR